MSQKTYFQRIEEKIREKEQQLGRSLTLDEQDQCKFEAMNESWVDASSQVTEEMKPDEG